MTKPDPAEMWKIEWWVGGSGEHVGRYVCEFVDGDDDAHARLMELVIDQLLSEKSHMRNVPHQKKRRVRAWLRAHPVDNGWNEEKEDDWKHVDRIQAFCLVDGVWTEATWTLTAPDIDVKVGDE